jgi:hypothetical protein
MFVIISENSAIKLHRPVVKKEKLVNTAKCKPTRIQTLSLREELLK